MPVRNPPVRLDPPNPFTLEQGLVINRVHSRNYLGNSFNPGLGSPTRFSPIADVGGKLISTLYAAGTLEAAIYETIFHDILASTLRKRVSLQLVLSEAHSKLEVKRSIKLASLREPDLMKWRIQRSDLITTSPKFYASTAKWAEAIHRQFIDIEGLVWTSNQCDPEAVYLFFGDRVSSDDFRVTLTRDGRISSSFLEDVERVGERSGIEIVL
ncbi:MAG: RES family NAD+ phosphorylase [Bacteroidota bacterium]|nr:RES family NAD+ phosphorylase [Bacteroidota bacterium]MDE2645926.1 RES family NAD+ phosphorylase [Bacteroidota bacterium]